MKARWKILIAFGVLGALLVGVSLLSMRVAPANSLEAYKNSLRARGEKLQISEIAPAAVPSAQNGSDAAQSAFSSLGSGLPNIPSAMWMIAPGKAVPAWSQPQALGSDVTNSWDDYAAEVAADAPAIEFLHQAAEFPKLDFGLDYQKGPAMLLPHLAPMKRSAQALAAAGTLDLHQGNTASATTNLCVLLHLIKANEDENVLISHLVRIAMASIAVGRTWDLLQATNVTDAELASLQKSWACLEFLQSANGAMQMERAIMVLSIEKARSSSACFDSTFSYLRSSAGGPSGVSGAWADNMKWAAGKTMWRVSWSYSQELTMLRADQLILQTLRAMQTNQCWKTNYDDLQSQLSKINFTYPGQALFHKLEIPDFEEMADTGFAPSIIRTIRIEAARRVAVTAIALKRYQLKRGMFPDNLSDLTPDLLSAIPLDPIDGTPLRYRKNEDGTYLLYSIGEDGIDNGGDTTCTATSTSRQSELFWQNTRARDWVWPQPATAAEIQAYWATNTTGMK